MTDMTGSDMSCDTFADGLADYLEGDASRATAEAMEAHAERCEPCGSLMADLLIIPRQAAALPSLVPSRDLWSGIAARIDAPVLPLGAPRTARIVPFIRRGWNRPAVAAAALVLLTAGVTHVLTRASMSSAPSASVTPAAPATPAIPRPVATRPVVPATPARDDTASPSGEARTAGRELASGSTARAATRLARRTDAARTPAAAARGTPVRLVSAEPLLREVEPVYDREIGKLRRIVLDRHSQLDPHTIAVLEQSVAVIDSAIAQSRAALARDPASGFLATQLNHSLEKKVELLRTAASLPART